MEANPMAAATGTLKHSSTKNTPTNTIPTDMPVYTSFAFFRSRHMDLISSYPVFKTLMTVTAEPTGIAELDSAMGSRIPEVT